MVSDKVLQEATRRLVEQFKPLAITTRYPGEDAKVEWEEAEQAIATAERVRKVVRQALVIENLIL